MKLTKTLWMFGLATALLGSAATSSFALPANQIETVYFSDSTFSTEMGYVIRGCNGGVYKGGRATRYRATSATACNGSSSGEIACYVDTTRLTSCPINLCNSPLFDCH